MGVKTASIIQMHTRNTPLSNKDRYYLRIKGWIFFQANRPKKQPGAPIPISSKIYFQLKLIKRDREEHFIIIKENRWYLHSAHLCSKHKGIYICKRNIVKP